MYKRVSGGRGRSPLKAAVLLTFPIGWLGCGSAARADFGGTPIVFNTNGGWSWFSDPRAIIDTGQLIIGSIAGTTANGSTAGDVDVTTYDFATAAINETDLNPGFDQDDHADPAFAALPNGNLLVTYQTHGGDNNVHWRIGDFTNANGGTINWGADQISTVNVANDGNGNTYSNPYYLSVPDEVVNFSRAVGYDPNYSVFTNLNNPTPTFAYGGHWMYWQNPNTEVLNGGNGRPYVKYASNGTNTIWFATTEDSPQNYLNSLYVGYMQFNAAGAGTVFTSTGTQLGGLSTGTAPTGGVNPPTGGNGAGSIVSGTGASYLPTQFTPVLKENTDYTSVAGYTNVNLTGKYVGWASSMDLDSIGNPYMGIVAVGNLNGGFGNDLSYYYAHFNGTSWQVSDVGFAGMPLYNGQNQYAGLLAVDPLNPDKIYLSADVNPSTDATLLGPDGKQHWQIFEGTSGDNGATWSFTQLTNTSSDNVRPIVETGSGEESLLWMQGTYTAYTNYNTSVVGLVQTISTVTGSGPFIKADTSTLAGGSDWVGGVAPGVNDTALFDSTVSAANEANLTSNTNLTWGGLTVTSPNGPIAIQITNPFTLTLGSAGINMTSATQNVTISSNLALAGAVNQAWSIASGRTLTLNTGTFTGNAGATLNIQNSGTLAASMTGLANDSSENGGILGPWATVGTGASTTYATLSAGDITGYTYLAGSTGTFSIPSTTTAATNYKITTAGSTTFGAGSRIVNTLNNAAGATTLTFGNSGTLIQLVTNGILNSGTAALTVAKGGTNAASGLQIGANKELDLNAANASITISSPIADNIAGASSLTVVGTNTVTLSGANTYTGTTYITSGTLIASSATALGTTIAGTTVASGATLDIRTAIGAEAVAVGGSGVGSNGALITGSGTGSLSGAVTLSADTTIGGPGSLTLSGAISDGGSGYALTKIGAGNVVLTGLNNYSGTTTVSAGTLFVGNAGTSGQLGSGPIISNATLAFNRSDNISLGTAISGTGGLTQIGPGTLTLTAANTYSGKTAITGGTLALSSTGSIVSTSAVDISSGAAFDISTAPGFALNSTTVLSGTGTIHGNYNQTTGTLAPGEVGVVGTLTANGNLSLSGGTFAVDLNGTISQPSDLMVVNGNLSLSSPTTLNATFLSTASVGQIFPIINYTGSFSGSASNLIPASRSLAISNTGSAIDVTVTSGAAANLNWNSSSSGAWDVITTANWFNNGTSSNDFFYQGDNVTFTDASGVQTAISINSNVSPGSTTINSSINSYTFSGSGSIAGSGGLIKSGSSTLTINTANTYTGGTTISAGMVAINADASLGAAAGTVTINAAALEATASTSSSRPFNLSSASSTIQVDPGATDAISGNISDGASAGTLNKTGAGILTLSGTNNYSGGTVITAGTIATAKNLGTANSSVMIASNGTLSFTGAGTDTNTVTGNGAIISTGVTISGNESAFAGTVTDSTSSASTVFSTSNSTSANAAYIMTSAQGSSQGFIALNGGMTLNLGSLSGITNSLFRGSNSGTAGTTTLSVGNLGTNTTFAGNIANGTNVNLALIKVGTGTLTLSGTDTYSGGTSVNGGTLSLASATAYPTNSSLTTAQGASVALANHGSSATFVPQFSSLSNSGTIDLTNNAMIVHNGSIGSITTEVASAYSNGTWNGVGNGIITSSIAAGDTTHSTAVGVAIGLNSFEGATVATTDVLLKYTYYGDANLDGTVNAADYIQIDNGFSNHSTGWQNGDFNYDGAINGDDYALIDNSFNTQDSVRFTATSAGPTEMIASDTAIVASAVPEPQSLALLAIGAGALFRRRRRAFASPS